MKNILRTIFCKKCDLVFDLQREKEELKELLKKIESSNIDQYIKDHVEKLSDGFKFKGQDLARIFAEAFHEVVKDTENYVVMTLKNLEGEGVDVIIVKEGKLAPLDKLKKMEEENEELKKEIARLKSEDKE